MIDLHMHTIFSDGVLVPAELAQRARAKGTSAMAITDHVDRSNLEIVVPALARFAEEYGRLTGFTVLPGCELTHVPPASIGALAKFARELGALLVVVHGETPVEPVPEGTNQAALLARVDVLAHPGIITPSDVKLAAKNGVALEISARKGHSLGNGHVAALAKKFGARLVLNTDSHEPGDLISDDFAQVVALGAGLTPADYKKMQANSARIVKDALARRKK